MRETWHCPVCGELLASYGVWQTGNPHLFPVLGTFRIRCPQSPYPIQDWVTRLRWRY